MIGRLHGIILDKKPPILLLDVQGVGYEVAAPMTTFYQLPAVDQPTTLFTHLVVREDAHQLFGFAAQRERDLFRALIKVNGVGPKLALSILSTLSADEFVHCVQQNNAARLVCIPGIGKKTAERLLIDVRDRLAHWQFASDAKLELGQSPAQHNDPSVQDAISALVALGYKPNEAKRTVNQTYESGLDSEQLIRSSLQHLAKGT